MLTKMMVIPRICAVRDEKGFSEISFFPLHLTFVLPRDLLLDRDTISHDCWLMEVPSDPAPFTIYEIGIDRSL